MTEEREHATAVVYEALESIPRTLDIDPGEVRFVIVVEFRDDAAAKFGRGVILSDAGPEAAAKMSIDAMKLLCADVGLEVGLLDLEALVDQVVAEDAAKPKRVGGRAPVGARPRRKRRHR